MAAAAEEEPEPEPEPESEAEPEPEPELPPAAEDVSFERFEGEPWAVLPGDDDAYSPSVWNLHQNNPALQEAILAGDAAAIAGAYAFFKSCFVKGRGEEDQDALSTCVHAFGLAGDFTTHGKHGYYREEGPPDLESGSDPLGLAAHVEKAQRGDETSMQYLVLASHIKFAGDYRGEWTKLIHNALFAATGPLATAVFASPDDMPLEMIDGETQMIEGAFTTLFLEMIQKCALFSHGGDLGTGANGFEADEEDYSWTPYPQAVALFMAEGLPGYLTKVLYHNDLAEVLQFTSSLSENDSLPVTSPVEVCASILSTFLHWSTGNGNNGACEQSIPHSPELGARFAKAILSYETEDGRGVGQSIAEHVKSLGPYDPEPWAAESPCTCCSVLDRFCLRAGQILPYPGPIDSDSNSDPVGREQACERVALLMGTELYEYEELRKCFPFGGNDPNRSIPGQEGEEEEEEESE